MRGTALAVVVIADAQGRQVYGLSSAYLRDHTAPKFGDYTVTLVVQDLPPWYAGAPGYTLYNRIRWKVKDIRTRLSVRRVLRSRRNPFYAETTSPDKSKP